MFDVKKLTPLPRKVLTPAAEPVGVRMLPPGKGLLSVAYGVTKLSLLGTMLVVWLKPLVGPVRKAPMLLLNTPKPPWNTVLVWKISGAQLIPRRGLGKNDSIGAFGVFNNS